MSREHDGWLRKLWESDRGDYIPGQELEEELQELISGDLAGQHFSVDTLAELLELHEGVKLNSKTLRQFLNGLVEAGEVVIARDGRGPGSDGRIYRSCSSRASPTLDVGDIAAEEGWDRVMEDFRVVCHSPARTRGVAVRKVG